MAQDSHSSGPRAFGERGAPTWLNPRLIRIVFISAVVSAASGATYGYLAHGDVATGLLLGGGFGALLSSLEGVVFQGAAGARLRRSPFLVYFGARAGVYVAVIVSVMTLVVWGSTGRAGLRRSACSTSLFTLSLRSSQTSCSRSPTCSGPACSSPSPRAAIIVPSGGAGAAVPRSRGSTAKAETARRGAASSAFSTLSSPMSRATSSRTAARSTNMSATRSSRPGA